VLAEVDGQGLAHGELVAQLVTLYVAGHEPTTALIGNGMAALLRHPDQLARLQDDPSRVSAAVPELLRYDGPNQFVRRIALEPMTIGERQIEPGDVLYVGIGAANHDPERWGADADELRIDRPDAAQHMLARLQADVALTGLLGALAPIRAAGEVTWAGRTTLRSVAAVPIAWASS
jgi:cytochrome P450